MLLSDGCFQLIDSMSVRLMGIDSDLVLILDMFQLFFLDKKLESYGEEEA